MEVKIKLTVNKILELTTSEVFNIKEAEGYLQQFTKKDLINKLIKDIQEELNENEYTEPIYDDTKEEALQDEDDEEEVQKKEQEKTTSKENNKENEEELNDFDMLNDDDEDEL